MIKRTATSSWLDGPIVELPPWTMDTVEVGFPAKYKGGLADSEKGWGLLSLHMTFSRKRTRDTNMTRIMPPRSLRTLGGSRTETDRPASGVPIARAYGQDHLIGRLPHQVPVLRMDRMDRTEPLNGRDRINTTIEETQRLGPKIHKQNPAEWRWEFLLGNWSEIPNPNVWSWPQRVKERLIAEETVWQANNPGKQRVQNMN